MDDLMQAPDLQMWGGGGLLLFSVIICCLAMLFYERPPAKHYSVDLIWPWTVTQGTVRNKKRDYFSKYGAHKFWGSCVDEQ